MPRTAAAPWQQTYVAQEQAVSFAGPASVRTGIRPLSRLESRALQRLPGYGYMMLGWGTGCPTRKCTVVRSKFLVRRGAPANTKFQGRRFFFRRRRFWQGPSQVLRLDRGRHEFLFHQRSREGSRTFGRSQRASRWAQQWPGANRLKIPSFEPDFV